jgi:N-methylhydantoinase A/oxoprolinase/acetone carboxylase beta subunit
MGAPAKIVNLRVVHRAALPDPFLPPEPVAGASLKGTRRVWFGQEGASDAAIHDRTRIAPGEAIQGPAVIEQADSTTLVPPGWRARALEHGSLLVEREGSP